MPRSELTLSGYKTMWLMAMFDLPVDDKVARRCYAQFRGLLLNNGFSQLQYSVYARCCESESTAETRRKKIVAKLPPDGHVRSMMITDRQFEKMESYVRKNRQETERLPLQLEHFLNACSAASHAWAVVCGRGSVSEQRFLASHSVDPLLIGIEGSLSNRRCLASVYPFAVPKPTPRSGTAC